ncbi:MAG: leucine-rich repeat domain-containing protein, partial [Promethearchaeota archaeon]
MIGSLKNLEYLSLSPHEIPPHLETLGIMASCLSAHKLITSLPETFGNLSNLKELDLNDNELTSLPETFGNLSNLKELNLINNKLASLPESFGNLSNLEV